MSDTCPIVGKTIREGAFRTRYDAVVIAVHRNGERIKQKIGDIVLSPGDTLLLETHRRFLKNQRNSRDFFLISDVPDSTPRRHDRALDRDRDHGADDRGDVDGRHAEHQRAQRRR